MIPHDQRRAQQAADLVNYFRMQGAEVQVASRDFSTRVESQILGREGSALLAQNTARVRAGGVSTGVLASRSGGGGARVVNLAAARRTERSLGGAGSAAEGGGARRTGGAGEVAAEAPCPPVRGQGTTPSATRTRTPGAAAP